MGKPTRPAENAIPLLSLPPSYQWKEGSSWDWKDVYYDDEEGDCFNSYTYLSGNEGVLLFSDGTLVLWTRWTMQLKPVYKAFT